MPEWYFDPVDYYILTYSLFSSNLTEGLCFPIVLHKFVHIILANSVLLLNDILRMANGIEYYPTLKRSQFRQTYSARITSLFNCRTKFVFYT